MSTTIKTNLNSGSTGSSLAAFRKKITCLLRWRQKNSSKSKEQHQNQQTTHEENCFFQIHENWKRYNIKLSCKEYSMVKRSAIYCKSISTKLQKIVTSRQRNNKNNTATINDSEGPRQYGRRVEIVAKLLSSTLIAKTTTEKQYSFPENQIKVRQRSNSTCHFYEDKMTVTDLTFLELREEYPDLNAEIRSILMARAQEGATISEIRDDYRKLTGLTFPIYEDITEFLLTIPHVTAYCTESRTRIFNIKPMAKTKHIHDMVIHQKPQIETMTRPASNHNNYRHHLRNTNYQVSNSINVGYVDKQEQLMPPTDSNLSRDGSEKFFENNCYQDNCKYLYNRIYNPQLQETLPTTHLIEKAQQKLIKPTAALPTFNHESSSTPLGNFNTDIQLYKNNNQFNNIFQLQHQCQQNLNNLKTIDTRRSSLNPYKLAMPISSRSSSPAAKSWYTSESAYTESDYEAHLLDFLLLGDDFLLYMARMELRCKFKKNQRILQSGLCVSGQTIGAAIKRVRAMNDQRRSIIVNIGSVDIMRGKQLIQIEHDFRELLITMISKGIKPILTTLAPLANYSHNNGVKRMLERFNEFIKREGHKRKLVVIDIWRCLVNEKGYVFFDCYQNEPRPVSGTSESYLFWNKIGRQRVLQLIESKLEY